MEVEAIETFGVFYGASTTSALTDSRAVLRSMRARPPPFGVWLHSTFRVACQV